MFCFVKMKTTYNFSEFGGKLNEKYHKKKTQQLFSLVLIFQENSFMLTNLHRRKHLLWPSIQLQPLFGLYLSAFGLCLKLTYFY